MPLQNWSLRKYPPHKPTLILHGSDTPWEYDASVDLDHDLDIYAEELTLPAHINAKGRHVGIFTKSVSTLDRAEIVVAGTDGTSEVKALFPGVKSGGAGGNAGDIQLYVEDASLKAFRELDLLAAGGKGGEGQDTTTGEIGGLGGDGGNAGQVSAATRTWGFTATLMQLATAITRESNGSEAQKRQMLQDFVTHCSRLQVGVNDKPDHAARVAALKTALGNTTTDVQELVDTFRVEIGTMLDNESKAFEQLIASKVEYGGGAGGVGGRGQTKTNPNGKPGSSVTPKVSYCYLLPKKLHDLDMPIAHPDQCAMVLHLAKLDYFVGSEASMKKALDRLTRLHDRLLFLDGLTAAHSIYQAYKQAEGRMYLLPRAHAAGKELASIAALREVAAGVDALLRQMASGANFYGHRADWVPRGSHSFYEKLTQDMLGNAELAEKAWSSYRDAAVDEDRLTAVRQMRSQARVGAEAARDFARNLRPFLESSVNTIASLDFHMKECKQELLRKIKEQAAAIARVEPTVGVDVGDLVEAATMVAFCPNTAMVLVQGAGLVYKAEKNAKIEGDDREAGVKQALLVGRMTALGTGVKGLVQSYKASRDGTGSAVVDDPGADKLMAKKEDYMAIVGNFSKALGKENIEDVAKAFDTFIDAALERNNSILAYNASVNVVLKKRQEAIDLDAKAAALSDEILQKVDPDLPGVCLFVERVYSESLWILLESLYMTQSALRFWSLTSVNEIQETLNDKPPSLLNVSVLSHLRTRLLKSYAASVERAGKSPQSFSGLKYRLSANELRRWTTHPQMKAIVKIPPVFRATSSDDSPFYSKANVRLHTVRFFARGFTTQAETLHVTLTHLGEETIVDADDKAHVWVHERIKLQFQYRVADMAFNVPGTVDGVIGNQIKDMYAMVGPFTSWLVEVNPSYNKGVDITDVSEAWLEFDGEFDSL